MARPDCPTCGGTGWKVVERQSNGAEAFASPQDARSGSAAGEPNPVWAVPCECTSGDRTERLLARARVPERYRHCDFENFDTDIEYEGGAQETMKAWHRSLARARMEVDGFAREFPVLPGTERGLLLMGGCGAGKTHLAVAALKQIVLRGHTGLFCEYRALLKEIQDSYNAESQTTEMDVLEPILKTELLVLDDLGSSKPSPWAIETLGHLLNTRYNDQKFTIITTNYLDAEMKGIPEARPSVTFPSGEFRAIPREETLEERVGRRIRSRLYEMCRTIGITAPDYRKEIRNASRN